MSEKKNVHWREGSDKMLPIGEKDLDPFGRKNEENPGNTMGPKHPLFGMEDPAKKEGENKAPFGAKFDPFGPPNVKSFGNPNNSHLKPPE